MSGANAVSIESGEADMLIYCTADTPDQSNLGQWGGACVRIADPPRFLLALDAAVRTEAGLRGWRVGECRVGRCRYIDRTHDWHREDLPPRWLLKPPRFQHQREFRAAWAVEVASPLEPLIVRGDDIAAACVAEHR